MGKNKKKATKSKPEASSVVENDNSSGVEEKLVESQVEDQNLEESIDPVVEKNDSTNDDSSQKANGVDIQALQTKIAELTLQIEKKESLTDSHKELQEKLDASERERDEIQASYDSLVGKLSGMKTIFSKMKEAEVELEEAKEKIEALTQDNETITKERDELKQSAGSKDIVDKLTEENKKLTESNTDLNSECERLSTALTKYRRESQAQITELQDEKYNLESQYSKLSKKINEQKVEINEFNLIKEELNLESERLQLRIDELSGEIETRDQTAIRFKSSVNELQQQLEEKELEQKKVGVETEAQIAELNQTITAITEEKNALDEKLAESTTKIDGLEEEIKTIADLKAEVHSKQLLIGKLRHEAIILNEHLTKSLTMLKQHGGENNSIDKELISNVIVSFLQFPRGDTKKFEALQLISALLEWNEEKRIAAGLSHSTGSGKSEEGRQSFVSLWTEFLEKESSGK